jgi:DNA invertase Pin-like site-specific DNA recombinase/predicted Fe-S protein YdhL (DUF1289 family)
MKPQQCNQIYKAALYLRLSKDDEGGGESASITTQRDLLTAYARKAGIPIVAEYVDDGYSGTNFERPGFRRMLADIESGKVNCVMTKDMSRLGRNSARVTDYTQEYFPSHHVRYLALTDGYDSADKTNGMEMAETFLPVLNELYARDISKKIRSAFETKMEQGKYISNFAPYGYQKDPADKNHLVPDPQTAPVVQRIFQMAADEVPPREIARYLNEQGIVTPAVYRCQTRPYLDVDNYTKRKEWTAEGICKLLKKEEYLGKTVQGKTRKISFKSKTSQSKPREEWVVVEGTHEPLVTEETFSLARSRCIARRRPPTKGFENMFSGIAKCATCGKNMTTAPTRKKGATYNLCCGGYKLYGARECSNHFIDYDDLCRVVESELRRWMEISDQEREAIVSAAAKQDAQERGENIQSAEKSLAALKRRLQTVTALLRQLYEDYATERITETTYRSVSPGYEEELQALEKSIREVEGKARQTKAASDAYREFFKLLDDVGHLDSLSKQTLRRLVDRIEVEQGEYVIDEDGAKRKRQVVRIYFRFIGRGMEG